MTITKGDPTTLDTFLGSTPEQAVVFCGSGVSCVAPSFVPSWYRLNAAALDGLRDLALDHVLKSDSSRAVVASLSVEDVPLVTFSQVLSDAFAGRHWLGVLSVLDGKATNGVHRALATLLAEGRCHSIVTTNFDTLIEQACAHAGLDVPVAVPRAPKGDGPNPGALAIHKIHGSVQWPESMVDLLLDKGRGLDAGTQSLLAAACRDRHLIVLGFSGDDFAMNPDYLGLIANAALPQRVTWVARPGSALTAGASAFLDCLATRGVAVAVERHQLEDLTGVASAGGAPTVDDKDRLTNHVRDWLANMATYPPTAALVLAQLLRLIGSTNEAAAVRAEIRLALPRFEQTVPHLASAPAAWALLGKEERDGELALADLRRAEQAMDRFDHFPFHGQAVTEQRLLRAAIRQNAAIIWFRASNVTVAERFLASAEEILKTVPRAEAARRIAGIRYSQALHALVRDELSHAMIQLEASIAHASQCGDVHLESTGMLMMAICLRASGEQPLAAVLDQRASRLGAMSTAAEWRGRLVSLAREGKTVLASGIFSDMVGVIAADSFLDELAAAREAGDPVRVANALRAVVDRDRRLYRGESIGRLLCSLELAPDPSVQLLYQRTVQALCATDLSELPTKTRFLLRVTGLGLDRIAGANKPADGVIDELRRIGQLFDYKTSFFVPSEYIEGVRMLEKAHQNP
ncbi:SIR2 family protein [Streptomyces longisporoflavus]|uniref:SIR2 family protein n=1 Tax=Streptomyces longisporoflavus TaxID=28044 RepID=A0ABW7QIQ2_9ACTN